MSLGPNGLKDFLFYGLRLSIFQDPYYGTLWKGEREVKGIFYVPESVATLGLS